MKLKPSATHSREGPSELLFNALQSLLFVPEAAVKGKALGCALPGPGAKGAHPASARSCVGMPQTCGLKSSSVRGDMGPWAGTAPGRGLLQS